MVKGISLWREYRGRQNLRSASVGAGQVPLALSTLCARVQGAQFPCAGQGRQPLLSRSDACVAPHWVLPDAGISRTGSKAAVLPSCAMGENERNEKTRHTEHNRTVTDLLMNNKTCSEESIYQIGTIDESISGEMLAKITTEFFEEMEEKFGTHLHILDWALHLDEGTPHIHERHVFDCKNNYGALCPQQEKVLEELGIPLPNPDKKNRTEFITF